MTTTPLEGILQFTDERQDGQLRDPLHPLRPVRGGFVVPRQIIRELHLRPGLMLTGDQRGRSLGKIQTIEGRSPDEYSEKSALYDSTALDPQPMLKLEHDPAELRQRLLALGELKHRPRIVAARGRIVNSL